MFGDDDALLQVMLVATVGVVWNPACISHDDIVYRVMQGLPVRGQGTKNNARTRKGKAVAIPGKKK